MIQSHHVFFGENSFTIKLMKRLDNSSTTQYELMLQRQYFSHLLTSAQQACIAFGTSDKSLLWPEFSTSFDAALRVFDKSKDFAGLQAVGQNFGNLPLSIDRAFLPTTSAFQIERILGPHDFSHFLTSAQQACLAFGTIDKSLLWPEFSTSFDTALRVFDKPKDFAGLQVIGQNFGNLSLSVDRAFLSAANDLENFVACSACAIQFPQFHFDGIEHWHSSIAHRMAARTMPWAMEDHSDVSAMGFSRIARRYELLTDTELFAPQICENFEEELGQPVPFDLDGQLEDREAIDVDAGLNPKVVAFPVSAYPSTQFSAKFEFSVEVIRDVGSDNGDNSGVFDPQHTSLFGQVEHRLRMTVESTLQDLVGNSWYRSRVPGHIFQKWRKRKDEDDRQRGDSYRLIFYADFMDLSDIIRRKDNWDDSFHRLFKSESELEVSLQRLNLIRKAIAHNRPLVRTDQIFLFCDSYKILAALGVRL